jgi:hypothetical protein
MPNAAKVCPHCGHGERTAGLLNRPASDANEDSSSSQGPLSPSSLAPGAGNDGQDEMELSLDEAVGMGQGKSPRRRRVRKASAMRKTPAAKSPPPAPKRSSAPPSPAAMSMDADHIRHLVCERPELVEPGLLALSDGRGRTVGVGYESDVGEIDLLGRDESGDYVVVMIPDPESGPQVVSEILHRMGWVQKHLCEGDAKVRGIMLLEAMDEELGYAAAAVAGTIDFRTWYLEVSFKPLEV